MLQKTCRLFFLSVLLLTCSSWGFFAHKQINRLAVFTLPSNLIGFYKTNIYYLSEHAVDPDKRRYADSAEAARHYLDADHYGHSPFDSIPIKWNDAALKYSADTLKAYGILPWHIERTYYTLVKAFKERNMAKILKISADLGHYIGDAHVPLHTTENYNGQLSGQKGIHAFWESRLPELFAHDYDFFVGRAHYITNPLPEAWKILRHTFSLKDSVLALEARLNRRFSSDKKYAFSERNGKVEKQYSEAYSKAYHQALNGMVEQQMRSSVLQIGSFWYSAWVDGGQPDLKHLRQKELSTQEQEQLEIQERLFNSGRIIGREE